LPDLRKELALEEDEVTAPAPAVEEGEGEEKKGEEPSHAEEEPVAA
jgi:hypothetical protein